MIVKTPSLPSEQPKNHREPQIVKALRWFWRFSNFYGEYTVRSPQERRQWVDKQLAKRPISKRPIR
ncbi:MAG: hypothetical protein AAFV72_00870 [Cyanobacteria bacterium J06635_1]